MDFVQSFWDTGHIWIKGHGVEHRATPVEGRPWEAKVEWFHNETFSSKDGNFLFLTPIPINNIRDSELKSYNINKYPTLFRTFSEIEPTLEKIVVFANQYGDLGGDVLSRYTPIPVSEPFDIHPETRFLGEPISIWKWEIARMLHALTLWDVFRANDIDAMEQYIVRGEGIVAGIRFSEPSLCPWNFFHWNESIKEYIAWVGPSLTGHTEVGTSAVVFAFIRNTINNHLRKRATVHLGNSQNLTLDISIEPTPNCFIGALWMQFALAISDKIDLYKCEECSTWIQIAPGLGRPEKKYCSDACRMRAYRKRKAKTQMA